MAKKSLLVMPKAYQVSAKELLVFVWQLVDVSKVK